MEVSIFFLVSKSGIVNISDFSGYVDFFAASQFCHFSAKTTMTSVKQVSYVPQSLLKFMSIDLVMPSAVAKVREGMMAEASGCGYKKTT